VEQKLCIFENIFHYFVYLESKCKFVLEAYENSGLGLVMLSNLRTTLRLKLCFARMINFSKYVRLCH